MSEKAVERQKKFLVDAIKDAKQSELNRLKQIDKIKDVKLREKQNKRYEIERAQDQQRIENLTSDFLIVQEKAASGELKAANESRKAANRGPNSARSGEVPHNRFAGFETRDKQLFYADVCTKFDNYDAREARRANARVFDSYEESRKLKLLTQKKEILQTLIRTQAMEAGATGHSQRGGGRMGGGGGGGRSTQFDARSVSSGESWATFATESNPLVPFKSAPKNVPKLRIG